MQNRKIFPCEQILNRILLSNPFEDFASLSQEQQQQKFISQMWESPKKSLNSRQWSIEQNKIYLKYLINYKEDFFCEKIRRKTKVYKRMSEEMNQQRTAEQCRGHHKKMMNRCESIDSIVKSIRSKIKKAQAKEKHQKKQPTYCEVPNTEQVSPLERQMFDLVHTFLEKSHQTLFSSLFDSQEQYSEDRHFEHLIRC